jgi:hypothetical protein
MSNPYRRPSKNASKFGFIWPGGFRREDFLEITNQKQEWPVVAMFVSRSKQNHQYL